MTTAMNRSYQTQTTMSERALIFERTFDAPRALVFQAWTDTRHLRHWWGPKDWTLPVSDMDFRVGGSWLYCMQGPDGMEGWGHSYYQEIVPPERIVMIDSFVDADDKPLEGMPPLTVTVEFFDLGGGRTRVKSHCEAISAEERQKMVEIGMEQGYVEMLDRLEDFLVIQIEPGAKKLPSAKSKLELPSPKQITMSRVLNARRELVFAAHVDPKLFSQWWGPRGSVAVIDRWDAQPGGVWRVVQRDAQGNETAFRGEFREIVPPQLLVTTFEWEGLPGHIVVDRMTLETLEGGKTRLTTTSTFASQADRDGMLASGMETGADESWDRLEELPARQVV